MRVEHLEDALQNAPFEIELDSGTKLTVKHADYLMIDEGRTTAIVWVGEHFHAVPIHKITSIRAAIKKES